MPVTLKDIAKQSGFSVTQVSRALAGYDDVSASTRDYIRKVANDLGYRPNQVARQLRNQRTNTLGFVMPTRYSHEQDDFFSLLLKGITYAATQGHFDVLIAVEAEVDELAAYKRMAGGRRVDGMIIARTYRDDPRIAYLKSIDFPFIVHGRLAPNQVNDFSYIDLDSQTGISLLARHLIELGHQHIGLILPPTQVAFTPYRLAGYKEVIEKTVGFDENLCVYSDLTYEGGQIATRELFERNQHLTAIIACNDWMALGAMNIASEMGFNIGESFAVVGYDDIPLATYSAPALTTIHQPIFEVGKQLVDVLITSLTQKDPTVEFTQRLIDPKLVVRASCGIGTKKG